MAGLNLPKKRKFEHKAAVWKRIVSFVIDVFVIQLVIFTPLSASISDQLPQDPAQIFRLVQSDSPMIRQLESLSSIGLLLVYAYFVLFEHFLRQTPGKMVMRLQLQSVNKKDKITLVQVLLRNLAAIPVWLFQILWIVDPLYLIITGERLTDRWTKTQIIEETYL